MNKLLVVMLLFLPWCVFSQNAGDATYQTNVIHDNLPSFYSTYVGRKAYPLSWSFDKFGSFDSWRMIARAKARECLLKQPPSASFNPVVIAEQDRGSYTAKKIILNVTVDSRILSYFLVPKGKGPFPAVLLLHDHGSKFDIGKEKVIEPFADSIGRMRSAREWVNKCYGGRFIGDELAKRGYICFASDALNWSDRGGAGYEGQQALASNLMNLGMSYAGLIAWEDVNSAEFLASIPQVDSSKIIAMGFSMGSFRAWQVAALSEHIAGSVAVCWMATRKGLIVPGGNLTRGQSAFTTTHPDISNYLDYPDVASIACPKPMLFYNGEQDKLFPDKSAKEAFEKMHKVWKAQNAEDKLQTKLWPVGHIFNLEMQEHAFQWLDKHFKE